MTRVLGWLLGRAINYFAHHHQPQPPGPVEPLHPNCRCTTPS